MDSFNLTPDACKDFNPTFEKDKPCLSYIPYKELTQCGYCTRPDYYRCVADNLPIPLSHSSIGDWLTCHRLYWLKAVRGISLRDASVSNPIKMGQLWDTCLQGLSATVEIPGLIERYEIPGREVSKVKALWNAFKEFNLVPVGEYDAQAVVDMSFDITDGESDNNTCNKVYVKGFYDRKYATHFEEDKLSSRPDHYLDPYFIHSQCGTYFLADPSLEYCTMKVVRVPDLKSTGKNKDEDDEAYYQRCYEDVISRPSHYFIGYDRVKHTYGRKFYRSEFNLDEIQQRYNIVGREIKWATDLYHKGEDVWYRNDRVCGQILPGIPCEMLPICRTGGLSDQFIIRQDKGGK